MVGRQTPHLDNGVNAKADCKSACVDTFPASGQQLAYEELTTAFISADLDHC